MNEIKTDKSLGQHWLTDDASLGAMCNSGSVVAGDVVLEIGPGTGTLTRKLLDRGAQVIAVELDHRLADSLQKKFIGANLSLKLENILTFDLTKLPKSYKLVSNIPYYLTSKLIRIISESTNPPSVAVLLIQKEVAERVVAQPGTMSILSVSCQFFWDTSLGIKVPAALFAPPPKVDSQILVLTRKAAQPFDVDQKAFFRLVRIGYSNRRKKLSNSLMSGLQITKSDAEVLVDRSGFSPNVRPQELSLKDWYVLYCNT